MESPGVKPDGKVDGWLTVQNKGKDKEVEKPAGKTLVVVG